MKEREGFPAEKRHAHVELIRAGLSDAELIWRMQTKAFVPLLERYQDADTNPANEPLMRVRQRLEMKETFYYLIVLGGETVGAVRVVDPQNGQRKRISPLFVLPEHQGKGVAQAALREAERMHGEGNWQLETIAQEAGNCRLYEKMGYRRTGEQTVINEQMTLITYEK
ncbi:MAG: GNAT family N-acetyltransferase [Clostridia bacterium]|nr:GNAT family N-acetyltransferase [Clostridia bacterium]